MSNLILIFLCLLPFGSFFFKSVDIWHAQGHFAQMGILILFGYSFFEKSKYVQPLNKPLGAFILWAGLTTGYWWIKILSLTKAYPTKIFMPFFNILCLVLLYKLIIEYLDKNSIEKILKWFKYTAIVLLFYNVLQFFGIDEFFNALGTTTNNKQVLGIIGNPSHWGPFLAMVQPVFFNKNRQDIISLVLLWGLILLTGSAVGIVGGLLVILFWLTFKKRKLLSIGLGASLVFITSIFLFNKHYFGNSGRLNAWKETFVLMKDKFVTGLGLGTFGLKNNIQGGHWQHLHNEYYQLVFELGIIGLVLVLWCIYDYFKTFASIKTDLTIKISSMFFGFCLIAGVDFVGHLWVISTFAMFLFASIYAIKNSEEKCTLA